METEVAFQSTMDHSGPPGASDDEDSFVVLETSPSLCETPTSSNGDVLPLFRTNKVREMQSLIKMEISKINSSSMPEMPTAVDTIDAVASSVAKITISPDSSYEEIQKQVEELIKENETLKNIIAQNNMSMKTQYDRCLKYRDEVVEVVKSYKEKFNEAKNCINKFKEENAKLVGEMDVYVNIKKLHEEEIISLKERIRRLEESRFVSVKSEEVNVDNKFQTELALANLKITKLSEENEQLKPQAQNLQIMIDDLTLTLKEETQKLAILSAENENLKTETGKLQHELIQKQQNLEKLTEKLVLTSRLEEQLQTKQEEMNVIQFEVSGLKSEITKLKTENSDLKTKLNKTSQENQRLLQSSNVASTTEQELKLKDSEIAHLQEDLVKAAALESTQAQKITELRTKLKELKEKYNADVPRQEHYIQTRSQLSISQKTITALEAELEEKACQVDNLRTLMQKAENDEMFALKEQLLLFKNDFEAEKESKLTLKRERDQIAEDLQNVQTRNKQLQNEIETLRARIEPPKSEGYTCPKCSFAFQSYQSLENHVHRCLDLDGFP